MRRLRGVGAAVLVAIGASCESPTKPPPAVSSVSVTPGTVILESGDSLQLAVVTRDANSNVITGRTVTWSSADTTRATISATGKVKAKFNRNAASFSVFVRATVEGVFDDTEVIISPVAPASIDITAPTDPLEEGDSPILAFELRDAQGDLLVTRELVWVSRDTQVVRVASNAQLTPRAFVGGGNRTTWVVGSLGTVRDSVEVTVAPAAITSIAIAPQQPFLRLGYMKKLRIVATTAGGAQLSGIEAAFTSSDASVATSTAAGLVTASTTTQGSSEIVAALGDLRDTVTLTVDACGAAPAGTYPMQLINVGPALSPDVQAAFDCAVARIRAVIRGGISAVTFPTNTATGANCFDQTIPGGTTTTGVIIYIRVAPIDGVSGILGRAGPCFVRATSRLGVIGLMEFDDADLANLAASGTLLPTILHEMLHVVGIGSTWRDTQLSGIYTGDVANPGFLGATATRECRNEHGGVLTCATQVPVEDCVGIPGCGVGTIYGHWREGVFDTELMTGYLDPPRPALGRMSIGALADLGYPVDLEQAEHYVMPSPSLMAARLGGVRLGRRLPAPVRPTHSVDANGRLKPLLH